MKKLYLGMRLLTASMAVCVATFAANIAKADIEAHGVLVPGGVFNTVAADGTFSVPYTVKSADTDLIVVGIYVDAANSNLANFQFGGVGPTGAQLNNQRSTLAYWSVSGLAVNQVINITGTHSTLAASQSNGYVWELSDIVLGSGVDSDMAGSELPIVNTMTTTAPSGRLVTSFFGANKQEGTIAPQPTSIITQFNSLQFGGAGGGFVGGGVGNAGAPGEQTLGWIAATGGGANGVASELAFAFDAPGTVVPYVRLEVNRNTGAMTLVRVGAPIATVVGYSITSASGALNQTGWNSIADNHEGTIGGGAWTKLTQPNSITDFSEFTFDESDPDGGQIPTGSITLGNNGAWRRSPYQDLQMSIKLSDNTNVPVSVLYTGNAILRSDFDLDGDIDGNDMNVFLTNYNSTLLAGTLDAISYASGDINGDQNVNLADWRLFKTDLNNYINGNGEGGSVDGDGQVPEPTTMVLFGIALSGLSLLPRRRRK